MGKKLMCLWLLGLSGCATTADVIAENPTRLDVTCRHSLGDCYERAGEECPNGFDVIDRAQHDGAVVSTIGNSTIVTPTSSGELIVECK